MATLPCLSAQSELNKTDFHEEFVETGVPSYDTY